MAKLMSSSRTSPAAPNLDAILREVLARLDRIELALAAQPRRTPKSPGAKPIADADPLAEIHDLMGRGLERWAAINSVACALGGNVNANAQRLRRKLRVRD